MLRAMASVFALPAALTCMFYAGNVGCRDARKSDDVPTYDNQVHAILAAKCKDCHATKGPGGFAITSYLDVIACGKDGAPTVLPASSAAPLLRALDGAPHRGLLTAEERDAVSAWVAAGAQKTTGGAHEPGYVDPRSPKSHGRALRAAGWKPMLDASSDQACGRCHEGVPSGRSPKVTASAPGAPSCTTCHTEPAGPLACSTCHGDGSRAAPPRDPCFFPDDARTAGAHVAHVTPAPGRAQLACATCHPVPGATVLEGVHGNGTVNLAFDANASGNASYDAASGACTTECHARPGGQKPRPAWTDKGPMACNDCHGSPPPQHYAGACSGCHRDADAKGTAFTGGHLHVNGRVDLGDGTGTCGACHGAGSDPWPSTGAHAKHKLPANSAPVACESCHVVPTVFGKGTAHPKGGPVTLTFGGLAKNRGANPTFTNGTCNNAYCHGEGVVGTTAAAPRWTDKGASCTSCHGLPPGPPHGGAAECSTCHGSVVDPGPVITDRARHVNGFTDK